MEKWIPVRPREYPREVCPQNDQVDEAGKKRCADWRGGAGHGLDSQILQVAFLQDSGKDKISLVSL